MSSSPDKSPVEAFLDRYWQDRDAGVERSLDEYIEMFPGDAEGLATEFLGLRRAHNAESTTRVADRRDPATVDRLGPYILEEELGRGAQGVVYKATNTRTGGNVAVKVLRGVGPGADELLLRFKREAQAAAKADHPGVCAVYDAEIDGGVPYIAMRYVEGETLARRIARTREEHTTEDDLSTVVQLDEVEFADNPDTAADPQSPSSGAQKRSDIMRAVRLVEKAARALHAVHETGVIHRDVKPGNIMVTPEGEAVVMDFGLARDEESDLQTLTQTGDLFGTPAYMSPEQLTSQRIRLDRRTDVWSVGVMLYECVTLRRPFEAPSREGLYQQILTKTPTEPRQLNSAIPRDLATVVATALDKDRDRRYQTALDLAQDLHRVSAYEPIVASPVSRVTRLRRWAQRNPALAVSVTATFIALLAGLGTSTALWLDTEREREISARALVDSEHRLKLSRALLDESPVRSLRLALDAATERPGEVSLAAVDRTLSRCIPTTGYRVANARLFRCNLSADASRLVIPTAKHTTIVNPLSGHEIGKVGETYLVAAVSPDARLIATTTEQRVADGPSVTIWSTEASQALKELRFGAERGHTVVEDLEFSANGRLLGAAMGDVTTVWDVRTGEIVAELAHDRKAPAIAFSPTAQELATANADGKVRIWDIRSGRRQRVLEGHRSKVHDVAYSSDGARLAAGSADGTVRVWNATDGEEVAVLSRHAAVISSVAFGMDGDVIAAGTRTGVVHVWDTTTRDKVAELTDLVVPGGDPPRDVQVLRFLPDGRRLLGISNLGAIRVWTLFGGYRPTRLRSPDHELFFASREVQVTKASVTAHQTYLWARKRYFTIWDADSCSVRLRFAIPWMGKHPPAWATSPRGDHIIVGTTVWTVGVGTPKALGISETPAAVAWSGDGGTVAIAAGGRVTLYEANSWRLLAELAPGTESDFLSAPARLSEKTVTCLAVNHDASLVTAANRQRIVEWRVTDPVRPSEWSATSDVRSLLYCETGVVVALKDGRIVVTRNGDIARSSSPALGPVRNLSSDPNGRLLGVTSDGRVAIWSQDLQLIKVIESSASLLSAAFAANGDIVSLDAEARLQRWAPDPIKAARELLRNLPSSVDRAPEFHPNDHTAWNKKGVALQRLGQIKEAIKAYEEAARIKPDYSSAHGNLVHLLTREHDLEALLAEHKRWAEVHPNSAAKWHDYARRVLDAGRREPDLTDPAEALAAARHAVELTKEQDPKMLNTLALALHANEEHEEAVSTCEEALKLVEKQERPDAQLKADLEASLRRFKRAAGNQ